MDFYKKINVDQLKSRIPVPQIQLPKIKSRKIFKSSREEINKSPKKYRVNTPEQQELPRFPPASFIEHTPQRISTVTSLHDDHRGHMDSRMSGSYVNYEERDFDDRRQEVASKKEEENLHQRFSRRYKEFQEFKFKNIFGKKTVVRKTEISMDMYADRYKEDHEMERQRNSRDDSLRSANYNFQSVDSPTGSTQSGVPTPIRTQIREQLNSVPKLPRKEWNRSASEDSFHDAIDQKPKVEHTQGWRFKGTLKSKKKKRAPQIEDDEQRHAENVVKRKWTLRSKSKEEYKEDVVQTQDKHEKKKWTLRKLPKQSVSDDNTSPGEDEEPVKKKWTLKSLHKQNSLDYGDKESSENKSKWTFKRNTNKSVDDDQPSGPTESRFKVMKKKLRKNRDKPNEEGLSVDAVGAPEEEKSSKWGMKKSRPKLEQRNSSIESSSTPEKIVKSKSWNFKRFGNSDLLSKWKNRTIQMLSQPNLSTAGLDETNPEQKQKKILRIWKRSPKIKRSTSLEDIHMEHEPTAYFNLRYFKKETATAKNVSVDEAIRDNKKLTHMEKLENAKDRAKHAMTGQMQKIKFFRSQCDSVDSTKASKRKTAFDEDLDDDVAAANIQEIQNAPAAIWASEQEFNQSIQSLEANDYNVNIPQVLIRQQSYENREPTLIITLSSNRPHPHISPIFTKDRLEELSDENENASWLLSQSNEVAWSTVPPVPSKLHPKRPKKLSVDLYDYSDDKRPFDDFENQLHGAPILNVDREIPPPPPSTSPPRDESPERHTYEPIEVIKLSEVKIRASPKVCKVPPTRPPPTYKRPPLPPPNLPERTASMVNLQRPIITQGSLRRKLSADLCAKKASDSVTNLINRFENTSLDDATNNNPEEKIADLENNSAPPIHIEEDRQIKEITSDLKIISSEECEENSNNNIKDDLRLKENIRGDLQKITTPEECEENSNNNIRDNLQLKEDQRMAHPIEMQKLDQKQRVTTTSPVPIPSPRLTRVLSASPPAPMAPNVPLITPRILDGRTYPMDPITRMKVQSRDDEYFSFSDEENANFYSIGADVPVYTKQSYLLEL